MSSAHVIWNFEGKLASNTVFGEVSMVFHTKGVNEIIASVTAVQRFAVEYVSHQRKILKDENWFTQRHTDPLIISRNLSEKSLMHV